MIGRGRATWWAPSATLGAARGHQRAAELLDEGKLVPKAAEAAADEMLRCVAADSGDCLKTLVEKAQKLSVDTVKAIQRRLQAAGYYAGPLDGKTGPALGPGLKQWRLLGPPQKS